MEVEVVKMEVCFLKNGSWSCKNGSFVFWKMEVEVVKMEVGFLKNGSWSCKNGSLFFEKWKPTGL